MAQFKITIPEPCHEQWNEMIDIEKGKFCGSCQKSVIDFVQFSDADMIRWFENNQAESCGRFNPEQLDRYIGSEKRSYFRFFKPSLIAASLFAFLSIPKHVFA
ncbi:hypothetical protein [Pedobacter sp. UBA5917]|jgi:hypothetical protein|uniref:hypothetical protein n=1 Tax=Pedobacter sp. UBA5917 TaxID=1947061 RepID=UPI0025F30E15|nr:hypothetical protein [Pedobacter sp. UBA5917]